MTAAPGAARAFPFGAAIIPPPAAESDASTRLEAAVTLALDAGAWPVIIALPPGMRFDAREARWRGAVRCVAAPPPARGASEPSATRFAVAALANSEAVGALVWPVGRAGDLAAVANGGGRALAGVLAVVDGARGTRGAVVVPQTDGVRGWPVWISRDLWRELLVAERGVDALMSTQAGAVREIVLPRAGVTGQAGRPIEPPAMDARPTERRTDAAITAGSEHDAVS